MVEDNGAIASIRDRSRRNQLRVENSSQLSGREGSRETLGSFQCLKGLQESSGGTWDKGWRDRTQGMASQCQRAGLDGRLGRNCSLGGVGVEFPRAAGAAPGSLAVPKARLDIGAWSSLGQWEVSLPMAEVELMSFKVPSNPNQSKIL